MSKSSVSTLCIACHILLLANAVSAIEIKPRLIDETPRSLPPHLPLPLPFPLQLRIWQCRQRCYHQTLLQQQPISLCRTRPDCYMCHDYCRVLAIAEWSLAASMCADRIFCSQGCRTACKFHRLHTTAAAAASNALLKD